MASTLLVCSLNPLRVNSPGSGCGCWAGGCQHPLFTDKDGNTFRPHCLTLVVNWANIWAAFRDQPCPVALRSFIPNQVKTLLLGHLACWSFLDQPLDDPEFSRSPLLTVCCDSGNVLPCCCFSHLEFHNYSMYSYIYGELSQDILGNLRDNDLIKQTGYK